MMDSEETTQLLQRSAKINVGKSATDVDCPNVKGLLYLGYEVAALSVLSSDFDIEFKEVIGVGCLSKSSLFLFEVEERTDDIFSDSNLELLKTIQLADLEVKVIILENCFGSLQNGKSFCQEFFIFLIS